MEKIQELQQESPQGKLQGTNINLQQKADHLSTSQAL